MDCVKHFSVYDGTEPQQLMFNFVTKYGVWGYSDAMQIEANFKFYGTSQFF